MSGRLRACESFQRIPLTDGWEAAALSTSDPKWLRAAVPGTAAANLRDAGDWSLDSAPRRFDAEEWCYRTRFNFAANAEGERVILGFEGLATLARVTLNDSWLLDSSNMFAEHRYDVTALLQAENELCIHFGPLDTFLSERRGRPRWRTPMVRHQQLRWVRTSLLGRTPGWSPPAEALGPWRPVWLERQRGLQFGQHRLNAFVAGTAGKITFSGQLSALPDSVIKSVRLTAEHNGGLFESYLSLETSAVHGELMVPNVDLWWPHTHGGSALYQVCLQIEIDGAMGRRNVKADLGNVGFRTLRLDRESGRFSLFVNDHQIFCRGAAWMPLDCVSLQATRLEYSAAIARVRAAGMNMLRVSGPTVYETDAFFDCCDLSGVMVWQDFMFANMDYPAQDAGFAATVELEARQQLSRLQGRPSLTVLCGNSEVAQQAAMSGAPREYWAPALFEVELARLSDEISPEVPYCPSSTHGGAFPFQPNAGVTSYYGVGAYLKPPSDARRSAVRFASECLAFANIPENETLALLSPESALRCHHPRWKQRSPRDLGAGWDFDDVRDHYMERLFRIDAMQTRYVDHDRYLQLGRVTSGEVMAAALTEWRRAASSCSGALLWFLNDLWPGAGWGVIDSTGLPKAAYYYIKRVLQPIAVFVTDEDCNGLMIHVINETGTALRANLELQLFRLSTPIGTLMAKRFVVSPRSSLQLPATELFDGFMDLSHSFRFGPPSYDVLQATLRAEAESLCVAEAFHFPQGLPNVSGLDVGLSAIANPVGAAWRLTIECKAFAQSVHVEAPGFMAEDQYFHMAPHSTRTLTLKPRDAAASRAPEGFVQALNAASPCVIGIAP